MRGPVLCGPLVGRKGKMEYEKLPFLLDAMLPGTAAQEIAPGVYSYYYSAIREESDHAEKMARDLATLSGGSMQDVVNAINAALRPSIFEYKILWALLGCRIKAMFHPQCRRPANLSKEKISSAIKRLPNTLWMLKNVQ